MRDRQTDRRSLDRDRETVQRQTDRQTSERQVRDIDKDRDEAISETLKVYVCRCTICA